eukprot:SM002223S07077  [mRNA]  locus=s2223:91:480:+ [translate_table: standard]
MPVAQAAKWAIVRRALLPAARDPDAAVASLPADAMDLLMRYLYKGLATGERALCDACLRLHAALTERAGIGCIVRALTVKSGGL